MSVTFTLYLWWLEVYLAVGAVLVAPIAWVAAQQIHPKPKHVWRDTARAARRRPYVVPLTILLWPLALWDALEYPVKKAVRRWWG